MRYTWTLLLLLISMAGCPRSAQQQEPKEYEAQSQAQPRSYKEPSNVPPEMRPTPQRPGPSRK